MGSERDRNDPRAGGKTADEPYFGLPFETGRECFCSSLGHSGHCGISASGLHGVAGLDERHQVKSQIVDTFVVAGAQLRVGLVVFVSEEVCVHIGADDDHGDGESFAEHISVESLKDGSFVNMRIISASEAVVHVQDRILLRLVIAGRE